MMIANHHKIDNLVVVVDNNGLQGMGETKGILPIPVPAHHVVDGHNYDEISNALDSEIIYWPKLINYKTIKGKGVKEWEGNNLWHYAKVQDDDFKKAMKELNA